MLPLLLLFTLTSLTWAQNTAISVADLPQCARDCLSNSTTVVATSCTSLNVACLCNSPQFVSTFYCCLSTQCKTAEQATAITFNQQQCAAVNATAPDFVGCSPLKATSTIAGSKSVMTVTPSNAGPYSTVTSIVSGLASFSITNQVTATFAGQPLLTGSCTAPLFAFLSASNSALLFPEIGCASSRQNCCPFDSNLNAGVTQCPQDYFTTAGRCCPSGYQVYSSALGAETPCYSPVSTILIPASTPSASGLTIITDHVFSRGFPLVTAQEAGLSTGAIVGITVVSVAFFLITAGIILWIKRKQKSHTIEAEKPGTTFPLQEPVLPPQQDLTSPQELASPETAGWRSPIRSFWPMGGFLTSPTFAKEKSLPATKTIAPQELPGSTYINEHHPAYTGSETATERSMTDRAPRTPTRSPVMSMAGSPTVTPIQDAATRAKSPSIISSVGSPRISRAFSGQGTAGDK